MTPEELRSQLLDVNPRVKLRALSYIGQQKLNDPLTNPLLLVLLTSQEVADRDASYSMAEHEPVAYAAAEALIAARVRDAGTLAHLYELQAAGSSLDWSFPQASFDQGCYIGEYGGETVSPAQLAERVLRRLGI